MKANMALACGKRRLNIHGRMTSTVTAQMSVWLMAFIIGKLLLWITMETGNFPLIAASWSQATGNWCGSG